MEKGLNRFLSYNLDYLIKPINNFLKVLSFFIPGVYLVTYEVLKAKSLVRTISFFSPQTLSVFFAILIVFDFLQNNKKLTEPFSKNEVFKIRLGLYTISFLAILGTFLFFYFSKYIPDLKLLRLNLKQAWASILGVLAMLFIFDKFINFMTHDLSSRLYSVAYYTLFIFCETIVFFQLVPDNFNSLVLGLPLIFLTFFDSISYFVKQYTRQVK